MKENSTNESHCAYTVTHSGPLSTKNSGTFLFDYLSLVFFLSYTREICVLGRSRFVVLKKKQKKIYKMIEVDIDIPIVTLRASIVKFSVTFLLPFSRSNAPSRVQFRIFFLSGLP